MSVLVTTSLGDLVIDLHTDECPKTCENFLKLCKIKYYNGCLFHIVKRDSTAHTGDPTGTGTGGDSIYKFLNGENARFFGDEVFPGLDHSKAGTVAMDSGGEHSNENASRFYITLCDKLGYLDCKLTVFGEVAEGYRTLRRIKQASVDDKGRPLKDIWINHTYILDDPFEDPPGLVQFIPDASPQGKPTLEVEIEEQNEEEWDESWDGELELSKSPEKKKRKKSSLGDEQKKRIIPSDFR